MGNFTWDDLQFFLAVARSGQLSRAARQLRTSHVTVSRRIDRLEAALRMRLFERNPRGYELTPVGRRLIETAERMEAETERMQVELLGDGPGQRGVLRMAVPEGFGSWFSRVLLGPFTERFPNIALELITLPQIMSLSRREADLTVTLDPPKASTYHSERIMDYTLHIYAAKSYLAQRPEIQTRDDLLKHPFIGYIEEMIFAPGLDYLGEVHPGIRANFKSSSIFNQLAATQNGLGLCVLPFYIGRRVPDLEMILPQEVVLRRTYWLTCHRDVRPLPRERSVMAFLLEAGRTHGRSILNSGATRKGDGSTTFVQ
ncbi:LysR family transcriptional regulator [Rhodobacter sphaeroides]|jgi:transcriptional regulator, LysR family|uniref:Transcriptional regulator, LysR family n=2 Tax=Cereibacter sphaeroides TaxID=1063 RepID=Q3IX29_CERS4|nr:LysR family transcriptional regulator [Cereibacter sphaeroides]EKX59936.1 Transcriptional regulator, LysR family [Rhodobacter sp. AKP1]ABA80905.1 transcriptional regulator, LysR family [Cereibacter sphaeroides 2.4.1]ACM03334.1 Transcriptional regulator, LysR family [Cereibacter sphaeroides KD131]AMJ49226.1 LysR family transcriptional regulator [Cereibacter sphaeroides]ANS35932.1 LysR family transcriptional regulator [Cereibacter sphaeroides]